MWLFFFHQPPTSPRKPKIIKDHNFMSWWNWFVSGEFSNIHPAGSMLGKMSRSKVIVICFGFIFISSNFLNQYHFNFLPYACDSQHIFGPVYTLQTSERHLCTRVSLCGRCADVWLDKWNQFSSFLKLWAFHSSLDIYRSEWAGFLLWAPRKSIQMLKAIFQIVVSCPVLGLRVLNSLVWK